MRYIRTLLIIIPFPPKHIYSIYSGKLFNKHIIAYACQLDRIQQDCAKLRTTISDTYKVKYLVKNLYGCGLFKAKFLEEWEAATKQL